MSVNRYYLVDSGGAAYNLIVWNGVDDLHLAAGNTPVLASAYTGPAWPPPVVLDVSQQNAATLTTKATAAIATLNQAETLLAAGNGAWDAATPAQRTALMLGLTRDVRILIRLVLGSLDAAS